MFIVFNSVFLLRLKLTISQYCILRAMNTYSDIVYIDILWSLLATAELLRFAILAMYNTTKFYLLTP